jgi:uncharacterized OsmC-like protein
MGKVVSTYKGDMLFETQSGNHNIISDVPATPEWGGSDRAPTPPEFLMMSLSSCVAAFLVKYCKQANINTDGMSVTVNFNKSDKPVFLKDIAILIDLTNAQIGDHEEALKRVCEHCVVHETLTHIDNIDINITTRGTENV